jgi:CheY-like chemotaxis protein
VDLLQKLIQAIATLLWPLIVILVLLLFRPAIIAIIESAKSRKFTLKIGGQELSMEDANQIQQNLIGDLQQQVSDIQKRLGITAATPEAAASTQPPSAGRGGAGMPPAVPESNPSASPLREHVATPSPPAPAKISTILWVDDNPKNNSYFIEQLAKSDIKVDLARSTAEAMNLLGAHPYDYILSNMGRAEGLLYRKTAGLDLLMDVRAINPKIPFVFFCSSEAIDSYGQQAFAAGATAMTSSPTKLMGILNLATAKNLG